ncbi:DUF1735 domain-containing protein [Maribellus luteus]|uniref:DUF1735 domain-containing protein n=1 Tax=Maribellus luteus TaxID=2305463 RepID=A0A399T2Q1_9BACT|nr:DUF1735 domain-containing protein [Maribellus luteus]RIJ49042.1 DUF1735 domain-containing protein [Maribellus luteus]
MRTNYYILLLIVAGSILTACNSEVDFGEQYKKVIYIVNSNNLLFEEEYFYGAEGNTIDLSVYCGGTEPTSHDIDIELHLDYHVLDSFNNINAIANPNYIKKNLIPESNFTLNNSVVTIKKGTEYGVLSIPFSVDGLDPDSCYVLPLTISSNSKAYEVNSKLSTIIHEIKMVNGFSGDYSGSSRELPETNRSVQPYLKAISANQVRMPIHTLPDNKAFISTNYMLLTIAQDSVNVTITPWEDALVTDLGGSTYNKETMSFELFYSFTDSDGDEISIKEKIVNLEYEED